MPRSSGLDFLEEHDCDEDKVVDNTQEVARGEDVTDVVDAEVVIRSSLYPLLLSFESWDVCFESPNASLIFLYGRSFSESFETGCSADTCSKRCAFSETEPKMLFFTLNIADLGFGLSSWTVSLDGSLIVLADFWSAAMISEN